MTHTLSEWDLRHREASPARAAPSEVLCELLPLLPAGAALDIACGTGRNALFLAAEGWHVTAVDGSAVALEKLAEIAAQRGIPARHATSWPDCQRREERGIALLQADLDRAIFPVSRFSVVLNFNFLQRDLFAQIERTLRPGGVVLFETYTASQLGFAGGPQTREFLLSPGELRAAFPACEILFYRELKARKGIASLLARKTADTPHAAGQRG